LCKDANKFREIYGDYYVAGWKMGSQIVMEISSKTKTLDTENSVSASLEASWSGVDKSIGGSASFEN